MLLWEWNWFVFRPSSLVDDWYGLICWRLTAASAIFHNWYDLADLKGTVALGNKSRNLHKPEEDMITFHTSAENPWLLQGWFTGRTDGFYIWRPLAWSVSWDPAGLEWAWVWPSVVFWRSLPAGRVRTNRYIVGMVVQILWSYLQVDWEAWEEECGWRSMYFKRGGMFGRDSKLNMTTYGNNE